MRPPEERFRRRLVEQWVAKGQTDLQAAETLFSHDPALLYPSCFFSQQAAEKYLKALLTWHQIEFPKTHVLGELLDLLGKVEPSVAGALADATALSPYSVEVRYPNDLPEPDAAEAKAALHLARKVRDAVLGALSPTRTGSS